MTGLVLYGINNLFRVLADHGQADCKLKGKELKGVNDYNPLAAGDYVELDDQNQIIARLERNNALQRFNWKLKKGQTLCANVDLVLCVMAAKNPPLHPRFLDRLLISCHQGDIEPLIVVNKCDLGLDEVEPYLSIYKNLGYKVHLCSASTGQGVAELKEQTAGQKVAFTGSSGVGKSSLLNALSGLEYQKTAEINKKFNRGNHQTNFAICIARPEGGYWIDTPGVRDLTPNVDNVGDLASFYPEFEQLAEGCAFSNCLHLNERECAIKDALEAGTIAESRYLGYAKLCEELELKSRHGRQR